MDKIIIGLVGEAAAGKGTVAAFLVEKFGAQTFRFSKIINDVLERLHLEQSRDNQSKMSVSLRQTFGEDLFSRAIAGDCRAADAGMIVIDGIRRDMDVTTLKDLPGFHLIYVTAPVELRWERARKRGEKAGESDMSLEQFKEQEKLPTEVAIKEVGARAEFSVDNSGKFDELYTSMESIIEYVKAGDFDHPHPHRNKLHPTL